MSKIKYTKKITDRAIEMRLKGFTIPEITKETGVGKPSLQKLFQKNSIKLNEEQKALALAQRWANHEPVKDGYKICSKCHVNKPIEEFHINSNRISGLVSSCKTCYKSFYKENAEEIKARTRKYRIDNLEAKKQMDSNHYENNKQIYLDKANKWAKDNHERKLEIHRAYDKRTQSTKNARTAKYRADKIKATPKWLTQHQLDEIRRMYENCPKGFHVDHIIPLRGDNVSGLHLPWNLQYLPALENMSKGNKL